MKNYVVKTTENGLLVEINKERMKLVKESFEDTQNDWAELADKYKDFWTIELCEETPKCQFRIYDGKKVLLVVNNYGYEVIWELWKDK